MIIQIINKLHGLNYLPTTVQWGNHTVSCSNNAAYDVALIQGCWRSVPGPVCGTFRQQLHAVHTRSREYGRVFQPRTRGSNNRKYLHSM